MSPEELELVRYSIKLSEDNNKILRKVERHMKWQAVWSIIKILVIFVPLILGYIFLQPYLGTAENALKEYQSLLN